MRDSVRTCILDSKVALWQGQAEQRLEATGSCRADRNGRLAGLWTKSAMPNDTRHREPRRDERVRQAVSWSGGGAGPRYFSASVLARCSSAMHPVCALRVGPLGPTTCAGVEGRSRSRSDSLETALANAVKRGGHRVSLRR
jgi:hypothetical protein